MRSSTLGQSIGVNRKTDILYPRANHSINQFKSFNPSKSKNFPSTSFSHGAFGQLSPSFFSLFAATSTSAPSTSHQYTIHQYLSVLFHFHFVKPIHYLIFIPLSSASASTSISVCSFSNSAHLTLLYPIPIPPYPFPSFPPLHSSVGPLDSMI